MLNRRVVVGFGIVATAASLSALAEPNFDRQLALDLASSHVRYVLRGKLGEEFGDANYRKAFVREATVKGGRTYVFVAFPSMKTSDAAFATLQYCEKTGLLVASEVGLTTDFNTYRQSLNKINKSTYVALANACPIE